ncbi:hypothetical protein [Fulvivirga sediminis]|uniref:DUF2460 domain-containing protein n=1 Tax=Fulvivirga sediminis TaxID=2803949 RepID=A0A937F6W8_9BACT|nr:hypothetical protein [Fulvivirga sediminis]MBL3655425.1 hypothetical protein [Fulvivirga sediminis]
MKLTVLMISLFLTRCLFAQDINQRCKWVKTFNEPFNIDTLTLSPNSIFLNEVDNTEVSVYYDFASGKATVDTDQKLDSIQVCYSVLPFNLSTKYYHRSLDVYDSNAIFKDPVKEDVFMRREQLFASEGINKSGSISRGISFGSNQDVFVNSTLNLNLEGKLTEDLNIRAAITDQNVPFQPEGNTQQLQDFDNVFIQVYNDKFSVTGGDVVLKNRSSYFLKYYKNVQGGLAEVNYNLGKSELSNSLGISVAKGKFNSVQIKPLEGVQGPYRVPGPSGQNFIIILANSEKVFLDGKQLSRGYNNDYVIDYNSAEITFTNKVLITQFSRIRVDYEYSDQNYGRTIVTASHYQNSNKFGFFVNYYSEKDNKNRPLLVDLTTEDKQLLSEVGDRIDEAVISGVDSLGFSQDRVLYQQKDTIDNDGTRHRIYKYSTDSDEAFYQVVFSDMGLGNGNYVYERSTANGRVYMWVSPQGGVPQGQYEPVQQIAPPNKKQMTNIGATYALSKNESLYVEMAFSDQDLNLYSEIDNEDNNGFAIKTGLKSEKRKVSFLKDYLFNSQVEFEFDDQDFVPIDRFRYIEYDRDWGYDPNVQIADYDDFITNASLGIRKDSDNGLDYTVTYRRRGLQVDGFQQKGAFDKTLGNFQLRSNLFWLNSEQDSINISWKRLEGDLSYTTKWVIPGYQYSIDHNLNSFNKQDSLVSTAMYFNSHAFYLKNIPDSKLEFLLQHDYRKDKNIEEGSLNDYTTSNTSRLSLARDFKNHRIGLLFTYRKLAYDQTDELEETVAGRLDLQNNFFKRHIISNLTYALANSQEPRKEFVYVKVPTGEGTYTWRDLNDDGVQDLDEFFEAINLDERNYVRIFTLTNDFITAFQNTLTYRVSLQMPRDWKNEHGWKQFLSRFSNNTSWAADVKTTDRSIDSRLLGFMKSIEESEVITEKNVLRTTFFYNRANVKYGGDFSFYRANQKQLLTGGFEARDVDEYTLNGRVNFSRQYNLKVSLKQGEKDVNSDFLNGRNYLIVSQAVSPEISWQPKGNFRLSLEFNYEEKNNTLALESIENAFIHEAGLNIKLNKAASSTFSTQIKVVNIDFNGEENSPVGYDMLNALRPGENFTWTVNWQQKVASGLQLNLSYNGRKSEESDVIHVGRVQVSALF